jgi:S1-C subfamily serine protease
MMRFVTISATVTLLLMTQINHGQDIVVEIGIDRIQRSTVYIMQMQNVDNRTITQCVGSGTLVDRRGLIVTNAHHTVPSVACPGDILVIALSTNPDEPPIPTYRAEIAQANPGLDLALLRITEELNGRKIEPNSLFLPFVELANSDQVLLDDTVWAAGYSGIQNDSVGTIIGTISGFVAEPSGGTRSWIKTDAAIPGTMSGGGVFNESGRLIGVSTTVPITGPGAENCLNIEDTNGDGLVNQNDRCVPVGSFINALRPSNFARPLLRSASLGLTVEKLSEPSQTTGTNSQPPTFSNLVISPSVANGQPSTIIGSLPTGTTSLFLFFDYQNMTPDTTYELRVLRDNIPDPRFGLAPIRWSGGRSGSWYIGSSDAIWPNGRYTFELSINGATSQAIQIDVGISPTDVPTFRNLSFGLEVGDNLIGTGNVLPQGSRVTARFIHQNLQIGTPWTVIWYFNDELRSRQDLTWSTLDQQSGSNLATVRLETEGGIPLPPGRYRLELYIEGQLATRGDFIIAGLNAGALPLVFQNTRFVTANTPSEAITAQAQNTFSNTTSGVYSIFDWNFLAPGTLWQMRWSVDDVIFYEQTSPWQQPADGENFLTLLQSSGRIPDGTYRVSLSINNITLAEQSFAVGIGQLPIDPFASAEGVQLNGRIIDAETGEGIPGVTFLLISEDFSIEDFVWDSDQLYAQATTDQNGRFQLSRLLQYDAPYSVMIAADGYLPISADGIVVRVDSPNPQEIVIPLLRD